MRIAHPVTVLAAVFSVMSAAGAARAQIAADNPYAVYFGRATTPSWERSLQRYYDRQRLAEQQGANPLAGLRLPQRERSQALLRRFYADPALALGYPSTTASGAPESGEPPAATAALAPLFPPTVDSLDADGDGAISRQEYFSGRARLFSAGPQGGARASRYNERLASQFRALDANHDGRVTPAELAPFPHARF